jgi:hypothetical protein
MGYNIHQITKEPFEMWHQKAIKVIRTHQKCIFQLK